MKKGAKPRMSTFIMADSRLLHLQITIAWKNYLSIRHFIIADDMLASDPFRSAFLLSDSPDDIEVVIKDLARLQEGDALPSDGRNTLVITGNLKNVQKLMMCPFVADAIYVSFVRSRYGGFLARNYALLDQEDCRILDGLDKLAAPLIFQRCPADPAFSWNSIKGDAGYV